MSVFCHRCFQHPAGRGLVLRRLLRSTGDAPALSHLQLRSSGTAKPEGAPLSNVRGALDKHIIGHAREKEALLLALIAKEHIYIEGPPGVGKTMLAETAAQATGLSFFFYQMHRDTKLHELIGDAVIVRESHPEGGELIRTFTRPGGILTAELCVLDDISRAPGEALNVLLRLLNERQYSGQSSGGGPWMLPLRTAIATSNPSDPGSRYYTEPLDPANLDRFVLQLRAEGAISSGRWEEAESIIDLFCSGLQNHSEQPAQTVDASGVDSLAQQAAAQLQYVTEAHDRVIVPPNVRRKVMQLLQQLTGVHGVNAKNSLLTDRTFLVKALRIMRARAVLHGRAECTPEDLKVFEYLTTFRVPEAVHSHIESIIKGVLDKA